MKDIRQSENFAKYMQKLGWRTEKTDDAFVYLLRFPILGYFAKIPRPNMPINIKKILDLKKKRRIFRLKISPNTETTDKNYHKYKEQFFQNGFRIEQSPFNPTTNYLVDLRQKKEDIFRNFSEAKRRGVRRALKNKILVRESHDISAFIKIRQHQYLPVWFLVGGDMQKLWQLLYPKNASLLLAYDPSNNKPVAGILLLIYDTQAYYWFASSLPIGKKMFAPTLLVWEAIKHAKKRGCKIFDFEGIYDERFPKASRTWKGFTKFKEGFGGEKVVYMENFYI